MKIGILTFHYSFNVGAVLQAYALQRYLSSQGLDAEIVDYRPAAAIRVYERPGKPFLRDNGKFSFNRGFFRSRIRLSSSQFLLRRGAKVSRMPLLSEGELREALKAYTHLIYGSDEIWNVSGFRGFNPVFFGQVAPSHAAQITYAASAGSCTSLAAHGEEIRRLLGAFAHLSVRDEPTQRLVSDLCGRRPALVADPTLLWGFEEDRATRRPYPRPYFLVYLLNVWLTAEEQEYVDYLSRELKLEPIFLFRPWGRPSRMVPSPLTWVSWFRHASLVFTDSFHGTLFGARFGVPTLARGAETGAQKRRDFLTRFGLLDRMLPRTGLKEAIPAARAAASDLRVFDATAASLVADSKAFLQHALLPRLEERIAAK